MLVLIRPEFHHVFASYLASMHRLRYRVFKERLGWSVGAHGGMERDDFDSAAPAYLLRPDHAGNVTACARLLPTTGSYMLRDTFSSLAGGETPPNSPTIWESSRFAVEQSSSDLGGPTGLSRATFELFAGMLEFGLATNLAAIVTVTDLRMERILRRAGWPLRRIGEALRVDTTMAVAGMLEVSAEALQSVRRISGITCPVLWEPSLRRCGEGSERADVGQ